MDSVRVELFGMARVLAGRPQVDLPAEGSTTPRQALAALAHLCPALVGPVLDPMGGGLTAAYVCNLNGERFLAEADLERPMAPGEQLLLVPAAAGG